MYTYIYMEFSGWGNIHSIDKHIHVVSRQFLQVSEHGRGRGKLALNYCNSASPGAGPI